MFVKKQHLPFMPILAACVIALATPADACTGITLKSGDGAVGLDAPGKDFLIEGLNETGLVVNVFYHPGYADFDPAKADTEGMRSATLWTTAYDSKNFILQYHTRHNRRVRQMDLKKIDFSKGDNLQRLPLDSEKQQDIDEVTPIQ